MALKMNFYNEIFENEQKWEELINKNLLNSIYCSLVLKPFYTKKRVELENEYNASNNQMIKQILSVIDSILFKIEEFKSLYENSKSVDIKELLPLFLSNQMSNDNQKENKDSLELLKEKKRILEDKIRLYARENPIEYPDYVYDDFPEENLKAK